MTILGLHHITLGCANAQRTVDFYAGVLGLRFVKKTVNFDAPDTYHLYFGDATGSPGSAVTFFEWPSAPRGRPGIGGTHHFALTVANKEGLLKWKRRLLDLGYKVNGPLDRHYFTSIYFNDPDGTILEIATRGPGWTIDEDLAVLGTAYREPPADLIGPDGTPRDTAGSLAGTPVFLGCSDVDLHIPKARIQESTQVLTALGAAVTERLYPGMGHLVNQDEIDFVRGMMAALPQQST